MNERLRWKLKRIESGFGVTELAIEIGVSQPMLSLHELGLRHLRPDKKRKYHNIIIERLSV